MKLFEDITEGVDLRFTHDNQILSGIPNKPDNALIYYIGNYPTKEILDLIDYYATDLKPPNKYWDDVVNTGDSRELGSGWNSTGFRTKYMEHIMDDDDAFAEALHVKARAKVRPIYIGHHPKKQMYSPANVCINMVENAVRLPAEKDSDDYRVTFTGK